VTTVSYTSRLTGWNQTSRSVIAHRLVYLFKQRQPVQFFTPTRFFLHQMKSFPIYRRATAIHNAQALREERSSKTLCIGSVKESIFEKAENTANCQKAGSVQGLNRSGTGRFRAE